MLLLRAGCANVRLRSCVIIPIVVIVLSANPPAATAESAGSAARSSARCLSSVGRRQLCVCGDSWPNGVPTTSPLEW